MPVNWSDVHSREDSLEFASAISSNGLEVKRHARIAKQMARKPKHHGIADRIQVKVI